MLVLKGWRHQVTLVGYGFWRCISQYVDQIMVNRRYLQSLDLTYIIV